MTFGEIFAQYMLPLLTFLGGSRIGMIINAKSEKKKSKATADQEMVKVDSLNIGNTKEMIQLYKDTIEHQKLLFKEEREKSQEEVSGLRRTIEEMEVKYNKKLDDQASKYNKRIGKLESQVRHLLELNKGVCATCEFSDGCVKRLHFDSMTVGDES